MAPDESPGPAPTSQIVLRPIEQEMRTAYIDYAMSVIVGRALPDVRDGLKPVHRRILHGMNEMGITAATAYMKCARIVGEVMGKFHPHGDMAVYDTLVRMAQTFSLRDPLIAGQGNFGSVDGDNAAAMRYTECRLAPIALEMLADIDEDTVDFVPNFDASLSEPVVLPSRLPNLLVNGSSGIAVGMSTNVPPHNLVEVSDAIEAYVANPQVSIQELAGIVKGPDFPTGGIIQGKAGILQAYATGRGIIRVRARASIEEEKKGDRERIIVTELPFQVNKSTLLETMADLVKEKKLEGISDLRDESDRDGIRVVIELKRDAVAEVVLNNLFKHTQLEVSFGILNLALVDNQPKILTIKDMVHHYVEHRVVVVTRRTRFRLKKAEDRAHILEGLAIALGDIDRIIDAIKASRDTEAARAALMAGWRLSEEQAKAILEMRLSKLTSLEVEGVRDELAGLRRAIEDLRDILARPDRVRRIVVEELGELKTKFGSPRRTEIQDTAEEIFIEDLIPDESVVVMLTNAGYIKRVPLEQYRTQRRGGKGLIGMRTREEDHVVDLFTATNHQDILLITQTGIVHQMKAYRIREGDRYAKGTPVVSLLERLEPETRIQAALPVREYLADQYLFFATKLGKVKKTPLAEYEQVNVAGKIATKLEEGDELIGVAITSGKDDIILVKNSGKGVRFHEDQVRPMGRVAAGVRGTECRAGEHVVSMVVVRDPAAALLTVTAKGKGKRTPFTSFNPKNRGAWGVYMHECDDLETGPVLGAIEVSEADEVLLTSRSGIMIRSPAKDIRLIGSGQAKGVIVQQLEAGDETVAVARLAEPEGGSLDETATGPPPGSSE